jgi:hypothetical protein
MYGGVRPLTVSPVIVAGDYSGPLNETKAAIRVILNAFLTVLFDQSAD